jgi:CelD/BcsL family acetyltransferase involved in cellulose biosynthesis
VGREKDPSSGSAPAVVVARTADEIRALRPVWDRLQAQEDAPILNADPERFLALIAARADEIRPHVVLLRSPSGSETLVIGWIESERLPVKLGYKTFFHARIRSLMVVYGGVLGDRSPAACGAVLDALEDALRRGDAGAVHFNHLRVDSPLYTLARTRPGRLRRDRIVVEEPHWQTRLPDSGDAFWNGLSGSRRRYVKRYVKAIEKARGPVELECRRAPEELEEVVGIAVALSELSYKRALEAGFRDDAVTRALLRNYAERGILRAYVLRAGGEPVAFEFGVDLGPTFYPEHIGYDPDLVRCSPGTVMFIQVLRDVADDPALERFDYGFGRADYKERFGTDSWDEASVYVFAPRPGPIVVGLLRSGTVALNKGLERLVRKLGFVNWIKRRWRKRLQDDGGASGSAPGGG